jgi:hypothetical protein
MSNERNKVHNRQVNVLPGITQRTDHWTVSPSIRVPGSLSRSPDGKNILTHVSVLRDARFEVAVTICLLRGMAQCRPIQSAIPAARQGTVNDEPRYVIESEVQRWITMELAYTTWPSLVLTHTVWKKLPGLSDNKQGHLEAISRLKEQTQPSAFLYWPKLIF